MGERSEVHHVLILNCIAGVERAFQARKRESRQLEGGRA